MMKPELSAANDPRVDAFIAALPEWQQSVCREVRALVHAADREVQETIKRTTQPYFVLDGNICAPLAARDHVHAGGPDHCAAYLGNSDGFEAELIATD